MRIVHIIPTLQKGGAERLVVDIVKGLDKLARVEVALVVLHKVVDYPIDTINHLVHFIPAQVKLSLKGKNKKNVVALEKFITDFKPDIIHSHLFEAEIVSRSIYYPQARWFSHCHDNMLQFRKLTEYNKLRKHAFTNAYEKKYLFKHYKKNGGTHFIAISNDTFTYFKKRIKKHPITLLHNAIDFKNFYKAIEPGKNNTKCLRLINLGSFVPKKNQTFWRNLLWYSKVLYIS